MRRNALRRVVETKRHFCRSFSSNEWLNKYGLLEKDSPIYKMEHLATFEDWLENSGVAYKDNVSIKYSSNTNDGGRTCHAKRFHNDSFL